MKIVVVGTGFVGLPHAAVLAEQGHEVWACDIDPARITAYHSGDAAQIERYVNEPGLAASVAESLGRHLFFSTDLAAAAPGAEVFFMCINTPPNRDGSTDLSYYRSAAETLAGILAGRADGRRVVVVNKSTVPIGTARLLEQILEGAGCLVGPRGAAAYPP